MSNKALTDEAGEVRELDGGDIRAMRPAEEVLPADLVAVLPKRKPGQRGPAKRPAKQLVTLRIPPAVVEAYRATGPGWQTRMTRVLERGLRRRVYPGEEISDSGGISQDRDNSQIVKRRR
jgi:uncharacterized protein (DUF4415 family)